jgi:hypothetical protein
MEKRGREPTPEQLADADTDASPLPVVSRGRRCCCGGGGQASPSSLRPPPPPPIRCIALWIEPPLRAGTEKGTSSKL